MVCGMMNPSSSSEPTARRCWAPWRRGSDEVVPVQRGPGYCQRGGYPGGAVRVVRHSGWRTRQHSPVQPGLGRVGSSQQALAAGGRDRRGVLTPCPDRGQHHTGGAPRRGRSTGASDPGSICERGVPACRGHQIGEPLQRDQLTAGASSFSAVSCRRPNRHTATVPCECPPWLRVGSTTPRSQLELAQRAVLDDLGKDRRQTTDPRVQRVTILGRSHRPHVPSPPPSPGATDRRPRARASGPTTKLLHPPPDRRRSSPLGQGTASPTQPNPVLRDTREAAAPRQHRRYPDAQPHHLGAVPAFAHPW